MNSPNEKSPNALIPQPNTNPSAVGRGDHVVSRMVGEALDLVRRQLAEEEQITFKIGDFELRGPDYRQVLWWAIELQFSPEDVLKQLSLLQCGRLRRKTLSIENGSIKCLVWDGKLLPLRAFKWIDGLQLEDLTVLNQLPEWPTSQKIHSLRALTLNSLGLKEFDFSTVPGLTVLACSDNRLTELDLSPIRMLSRLWCIKNHLTKLDLSPTPGLTRLACTDNKITTLDLSLAPYITDVWCGRNQLKEIKLSRAPELTHLHCGANQLTKIDLSSVPGLTYLMCSENQLTKLDLSPAKGLNELWCSGNQLTELDLRPLSNPNIEIQCDEDVRLIH